MPELNRRKFLIQTTLSAAAVGLLADEPAARLQQDEPGAAAPEPVAPDSTMMLHVRDAATGEVALFIDHREIIFRDARLVARLISAAQNA